LAVHRAQALPRDTFAFKLWPDVDEESARANLRRHLHYLTQVLPFCGSSWVVTDRRSLRWNPQLADVFDVDAFEKLCLRPETRSQAIDVYRGDLLEGVDEECLFDERERLQSLQLATLTSLVEDYASADPPQAIRSARRLLQIDPWREDVLRALMLARHRLGDRAGALGEYEHFARRLASEFDVAPAPETQACQMTISRSAPPPLIESVPRDRSPLDFATLPLAGRTRELERLSTLWANAVSGRGAVALIGGEAGIGKTRLAQELAARAGCEGTVAIGLATVAGASPYQTLADAVRALPLAALAIETVWLSVLAKLISELRSDRLPALPDLDRDSERTRYFEAFLQALLAASTERPLLIILEDLHWSDAATIESLQYFLPRIVDHPIMIVGSYREEEAGHSHPVRTLRQRLRGRSGFAHVALGALPRSAVWGLVRAVAREGANSEAFVDRLFQLSEGNPLLLVEALHESSDTHEIVFSNGSLHIRETAVNHSPAGAKQRVGDRLLRLSPESRALAEIGSVVGRGFTLEMVTELSGWSEADVLRALDQLLERHVLRDSAARSGEDYVFSHHLLQAAAYELMPAETLVRRHHRTARFLEQTEADCLDERAAEIALHFQRGGDAEKAAPYWLHAARRALAIGVPDEALRLVALAKAGSPARSLQFDLLLIEDEALARVGRGDDRSACLDALDAFADASDPSARAIVLQRRMAWARTAIDYNRFDEFATRLAELGEEFARPLWCAESAVARAEFHLWAYRCDESVAAAEAAVSISDRYDLSDVGNRARVTLARARGFLGDRTFAENLLSRVKADVAGSSGNYMLERGILSAETDAVANSCDGARFLQAGQQMIALAESSGNRIDVARGLSWCATASDLQFDATGARRYLEQSLQTFQEIGQEQLATRTWQQWSYHALMFEPIDEAIAVSRRCEELCLEVGDSTGALIGSLNLSDALAINAQFDDAKLAAERAIAFCERANHPSAKGNALVMLGQAERGLGRLRVALAHTEQGVAIERDADSVEVLGNDLSELATLYLLLDINEKLRPIVDEATRLYARVAQTHHRAEGFLWTAAKCLCRLGDEKAARALLLQAKARVDAALERLQTQTAVAAYRRFPVNAEIYAAAERNVWDPPVPLAVREA
jgi:DNA-binding SARP family transcriptional activator